MKQAFEKQSDNSVRSGRRIVLLMAAVFLPFVTLGSLIINGKLNIEMETLTGVIAAGAAAVIVFCVLASYRKDRKNSLKT